MYTQAELNLITLSSFSLPHDILRSLLSDFTSSSPDFENHPDYLIKTLTLGVYNKVKEQFYDPEYRERFLSGLEKRGIKCVTYFSQDYPETLKNIIDPPVNLFCKGDTNLLKSQCFAIVGSRKTMPKILSACKKISGELSQEFTIVTGLAEGADTKALEGALESGGKVISVLANGFDRIYPAGNANLLKKVERCGLVITEYLPEVRVQRFYFSPRNRIIAGLARGVLVVSAGEKSGALITANHAVDNGRDVFAFPYNADIPSGEGCNNLLKNGACLTRNVLDIFTEYGLDLKRREKAELSEDESAVYELIRNSGEAFLPEISEKLNKPVSEITTIVMSLTIKGLAVSIGGNRYSAVQ